MFLKLFPAYLGLYISYIVTLLLPLVYGFTLLHIRLYRVNKYKGKHPRTVLGIVFLLIGLLLIQAMFQDFYMFYTYKTLNGVPFSMNFGLILPPLLYLYFRKLMIPEKLGSKLLLMNVLPMVIIALFEIVTILLHYTDNLFPRIIFVGRFYMLIYPIPLILSATCYFFYIIRLRKSYIKNINDNYSFIEGIDLHWINTIIVLYVLLIIIILPSFIIQLIWLKHISNIAFIVFVSYLFVRSLNEPHIYYESSFSIRTPSHLNNGLIVSDNIPVSPVFTSDSDQNRRVSDKSPPAVSKGVEIYFQSTRKIELKTKLITLFEVGKVHLKSTLTLNEVAQMLHTNRTYISNIVNSEFNLSFYQFVNKYRIDEAIRVFTENPNMTNREVAEMVGFNSISSFIIAFKLHKQCTPKEWRRMFF